jgi:tetratricopeptide (TPR) repeat protein
LQAAADIIDQALAADETNSSAHRWKAIISNAYSSSIGMKQQILNLDTMKYHLERAIELNPADATVLTLMGSWHTELLELSWYQRKFATTFLAELPECSYEEALKLFLRAEELAPKSWNRNLLLIGKTYLQLVIY